jgi:hypothetical protein
MQRISLAPAQSSMFQARLSDSRSRGLCYVEQALRGDTPYKALSYTWGDPNLRRCVSINGETISIGSNLQEALKELRDPSDEVVLWADQLCINQTDEEEKSSQVKQMKDI